MQCSNTFRAMVRYNWSVRSIRAAFAVPRAVALDIQRAQWAITEAECFAIAAQSRALIAQSGN